MLASIKVWHNLYQSLRVPQTGWLRVVLDIPGHNTMKASVEYLVVILKDAG
jgi:hypothetical protein